MPRADHSPLELRLHKLISDIDENTSSAKLDHLERLSRLIACDAFEREGENALEDAHRSLFHLYSRRVWRAPTTRPSASVENALHSVRSHLEQGFRDSLARNREDHLGIPPIGRSPLADWFTELATGPHPHENPTWPTFVREQISLDQLKQIVSHRSLFFLREPDPWIYAVPTLTGVAKAGLIDLLLDEYGWGKLDHMHSTVYARLMFALGLEPTLDHYETSAPWRFLAIQNHQWMLALTPGLSRQLLGAIYLTEADSPTAMSNYLAAWDRLGMTDAEILHFYELHVTADENHRDVALQEILLPTCIDDSTSATQIACGIFDGKSLEAAYASRLLEAFEQPLAGQMVSALLDQG